MKGPGAASTAAADAGAEVVDVLGGDEVEQEGVARHVVLDAVEVVAQVVVEAARGGEAAPERDLGVVGAGADGDRDVAGALSLQPCPLGHVDRGDGVELGGVAAGRDPAAAQAGAQRQRGRGRGDGAVRIPGVAEALDVGAHAGVRHDADVGDGATVSVAGVGGEHELRAAVAGDQARGVAEDRGARGLPRGEQACLEIEGEGRRRHHGTDITGRG
jgi:hypothetical protein